jgi:hypothetical protein
MLLSFLFLRAQLQFHSLFILEHQGTRRADTNALHAFQASELAKGLISKGSNHPLKAAVGKAEDTYSMLPAYPHTPPTEHTLIRVIDK